jgi:hypothetical protein
MKEDRERVERLERDLNNEKGDVLKLKRKLVDHLNLTKVVLLAVVFIPFYVGNLYAWSSQLFFTNTGSSWNEYREVMQDTGFWSCSMIHDPLSGVLYFFGFVASSVLILVAYFFCWYVWKEEVG